MCKTAIEIEFEFSRKKKRSFIAYINTLSYKLTILREKWRQSSVSHYLFKNQIFLKSNDHKLSSSKQDTIIWSSLGNKVDLSLVSFDLKCSVI